MTKSLYTEEIYRETLGRINRISADSTPDWGAMSAAQMFAHTSEVLEVANGKPLENTPLVVRMMGGLIRRMILADKPFPKNSGTHPQYVQKEDRDFETEKERLLSALAEFKSGRGRMIRHPLLGEMTEAEKGWANYKHLDHHLRQFGV